MAIDYETGATSTEIIESLQDTIALLEEDVHNLVKSNEILRRQYNELSDWSLQVANALSGKKIPEDADRIPTKIKKVREAVLEVVLHPTNFTSDDSNLEDKIMKLQEVING